MNDSHLKTALLNLPLNSFDKINLWLVLKDLKTSTNLVARRKPNTVIRFLASYNIKYKILKKEVTTICVCKEENKLEMLYESLKNFNFDNEEIHQTLGTLFSFPPKAVKAFCKRIDESKNQKFNKIVSAREFHDSFSGFYWEPYVRYVVRKGHEYEDSLTAKIWADEIRKELPTLAGQYEEEIKSAEFM